MADSIPAKKTFKSRFANAFKSSRTKSSTGKLQKVPPPEFNPELLKKNTRKKSIGGSTLRSQQSPTDGNAGWEIDEQTGERDHTALLHGLAHHESFDSLDSLSQKIAPYRDPGEPMIARLSAELWDQIANHLTLAEVANLAISSKTLCKLLGPAPWIALDEPENHEYKIKFLVEMDRLLPDHLLCFPCAKYHLRTKKGQETLKATRILNPLFNCPNATNVAYAPSRARLTSGHHLPFSFVQLVMRAHRFGPQYGISADTLSRRYKDRESEWMHQTRYYVHKGRLLLRIVSQTFAPSDLPISGQRHLLYSREDYFPYFSVCAHWRDGELMNICKCALAHVVKPKETLSQQLQKGPAAATKHSLRNPNYFVTQCSTCRPMRRCPQCPTEYLVELKLAEDRTDPENQFKQALTVTRWSDLGDGSNPAEGAWAAVIGDIDMNSFETIGKRALSGIFESQSGVTIPGQTILNLNPKRIRKGEEGDGWY
jgi:hypothetical protein